MPAADQADILELNERLTAQVGELTTERDTAAKERDEARGLLDAKGKDLAAMTDAHGAVAKERDDLKTKLAEAESKLTAVTSERDALAKTDRDFNTRLAAELVKHGVRPTPVPASSRDASETALVAEYQAITDPAAKAAFFAKHGDALRRMAIIG